MWNHFTNRKLKSFRSKVVFPGIRTNKVAAPGRPKWQKPLPKTGVEGTQTLSYPGNKMSKIILVSLNIQL
jgi:hypothetical protein